MKNFQQQINNIMNTQTNLDPGKTEAERFLRQPKGTLPTNTATVVKRVTTLESKVTALENRQNLFIDHWTIASADVLGNKRNNNGVIEQYDGATWVVVTIEEGDVWFDSEAPDLSVYNNSTWVIIPLSSESVYINRVDNISYVWTGTMMTPASSVLTFVTLPEVEVAEPTEDTKVTTISKVFAGFKYWVANSLFSGLSTAAKTIQGAINELFSSLGLKQNSNVGICEMCPILANDIVIDTTALTLTIATVKGGTAISETNPIRFFTDGGGEVVKHEKILPVEFAFTNTTGVWYFSFNSAGAPIASQDPWTDFNTVATVYRFYWNAILTGAERLVVCALETHLNNISAADHAWKHKYGTVWYTGFDISHNRIASGTPNADGRNTLIGIASGKNIDDNLEYSVVNSQVAALWNQDLGTTTAANLLVASNNGAKFKIRTNDLNGLLQFLPATQFPFPFDAATNRPQYISSVGARIEVPSGNFFVVYVYSLQDPRTGEPLKIAPSNAAYTSLVNAQAANWTDLQALYPTLNDNEIRPLYKLIYETRWSGGGAYNVAIKYSALRQVDDIRKTQVTSTTTAAGTIPATNVSTLTGNAQSDITALQLNNVASTKFTIPAYDVDMTASKDFSKTCGASSQFTIINPVIGKTIRLFLTGGTLNADLFSGYTELWILNSLVTDYVPASTNVLVCEILTAGTVRLFWSE